MRHISLVMGAASALAFAVAAEAQSITIATVNNGDMIRMQGLTSAFNEAHPDITVNWVTLEEVKSGDWGIAGNTLTAEDVRAIRSGAAV